MTLAPTAILLPEEQEIVVGSLVKLDGHYSTDPADLSLTYEWTFTQVPIGSQVGKAGFTNLEADGSIVSFAPDVTGSYTIQLRVNNGTLWSAPVTSIVDVRIILVPNHQNIIPDASFIWNYLSDFWSIVDGRKKFETFWSGAIQIVAAELLKLYQYDYNKSIRDVQDLIQKRWVSFSPALNLDRTKVKFILADDTAGTHASTFVLDSVSGIPTTQPNYTNVVTIPVTDGDFVETPGGQSIALGRVLKLAQRSYTMLRSKEVIASIDHNTDGASSGSTTFTGSGFTASMVGATLRILVDGTAPSLVGDYVISGYTSATQIDVVVPAGITWSAHSSLTYSVLPATPNYSSFFSDLVNVPAGLNNQNWRFSATLSSTEFVFEDEGVSPGDVIQVEISRPDLGFVSNFYGQVVSVDRSSLGFVLNLSDLVDGVAGGWMTPDIQLTLANDLTVSGLAATSGGSLLYTGDALAVKNTVSTLLFRRKYFEKVLTPDSPIDVGPFVIFARPVQIIRNNKIAVDSTIVSVPVLQEYVKQPTIATDGGNTYLITDGGKTQVSRAPYLLSENLDYLIDDDSSVQGICHTLSSSDHITIPFGDLLDRNIQEGDTLLVTIGVTGTTFYVRKVIDSETIQVYPTPTETSTTASFIFTRRLSGKFIRFVSNTFTKTSPAPQRFWAEVVYFDNNNNIENNFGVLVGITQEQVRQTGADIKYKSTVAGLMYALTNGPTISNMELAAQILLGLPFAQNAGVITEINPKFRLRDDGSPRLGRILIAAQDKKGNKTGVTNIYLYPRGGQIFDAVLNDWVPTVPDFSGLAINPETDKEYAVGDEVSQFAPLSKGVQVLEYLSSPDWVDRLVAQGDIASQLQKYHSFQLLINYDLVTVSYLDIVAQFVSSVKAHYLRIASTLFKSFDDSITIDDSIEFTIPLTLYEASSASLPTAVKWDDKDGDEAFLSMEGIFYTRYLVGTDLVTTYSSTTVTSASGGFLNPRLSHHESWDPPLLRGGDLLIIDIGSNAGQYTIDRIDDDNTLDVVLPSGNFTTASNQSFRIYRPVTNPIWSGGVAVTNGVATVDTDPGLGAAGVAEGDLLVFADLGNQNSVVSIVYNIIKVTPDLVTPTLTLDKVIGETTGAYSAWVVRPSLLLSNCVTPFGSGGETFYINTTANAYHIDFFDLGAHNNSWLNVALLQPGSQITVGSDTYTVADIQPGLRRAYVYPATPATLTDQVATISLVPDASNVPISVDFLDRVPNDRIQLDLQASATTGDKANTTALSTDVTLTVENFGTLGTLPGDFFVLLEGGDSTVDKGYGAGVFPIVELVGGGATARLSQALSATGTFRYGIRRNT